MTNQTEIRAMIEMCDEAIAAGSPEAPRLTELRAKYLAQLNLAPNTAPVEETKIGREAGSAAANQYGVFSVHYASEAQVRFLRKLLDEKNTDGIKVPTTLDGISKTSASTLIDKLLKAPNKAGVAAPASGASEKQVNFIKKLAAEKAWEDLAGGVDARNIRDALAGRLVDRKTVSGTIDWLMSLTRKQVAEVIENELESGIYTDGTTIYKVYKAVHGSGRMCAKELVQVDGEHQFDYRGLASRFVTSAFHRMTLDEAKAFGAIYGVCCNCGRTLTAEESIEAGIGPVCAGKFA